MTQRTLIMAADRLPVDFAGKGIAGGLGSNDDLQVMVYDGHTYSGNTSFSHFHVIA